MRHRNREWGNCVPLRPIVDTIARDAYQQYLDDSDLMDDVGFFAGMESLT